jgi:drug/metabolite transporter (DMT)-like permease
MVLLDWLRPGGERPRAAVFAGVGLGLVGLALLVGPDAIRGGSGADAVGAAVLVLASLSWAAGSLYTKFSPAASSTTVGTGVQMLAGGLALLAASVVAGEPARLDLAHASTASIVAFLYLLTFGSLIGFTAYVYLLAHTTAAKASTYAYVNPVVAVLLGWAIGHEPVTSRTVLAAAVILGGVAIISITRDSAAVSPADR